MKNINILFYLFLLLIVVACNKQKEQLNPLEEILPLFDSTCSAFEQEKGYEKVKELGTNVFPYLIEEINKIHCLNETNLEERTRLFRISRVLSAFGTNLVSLTPEFQTLLKTDRNYISALNGFAEMRAAGVPYLLSVLTNKAEPDCIRRYAGFYLRVAGERIMEENTNTSPVNGVVSSLIPLLEADSDINGHYNALFCLEAFCKKEEIEKSLALLIDGACRYSDWVERLLCVKIIGRLLERFNCDNNSTLFVLEKISKEDPCERVRKQAEKILYDFANRP
ncbi:MAG: hypothetical protein PHO36_16310 [Parabacteroides sp.]|nr:hypothetical protein [Parabacteroides sp.]